MPIDPILRHAEDQMTKALDHLRQELRGIRTGRASAGLIEGLRIEVASYGSSMTLKELANIAVAEGNVIVVKPFDPTTLKDIEKGIEKSELGINPQNDGKMIRLPVPPLSGERRSQLGQRVKQLAEAQKVAIRNVRRDAKKAFDGELKAKTLTEDDAKRADERLQKVTDDYIKRVDKVTEEKTKEITEV
jgi:ribosome recycling factor